MVLSDNELHSRCQEIFYPVHPKLINPASVDIRIGAKIMTEAITWDEQPTKAAAPGMVVTDISNTNEQNPCWISPGEFFLAETFEHITVPHDLAMELKLKSSKARLGWNHSLAFWVDPGWSGVLTMEIQNILQFHALPIWYGMRFAQCILHTLSSKPSKPYSGRYQHAKSVEISKPEV